MVTVPPYIGLNLSLEGQSIKRPTNPVRRSEPAPSDYTSRYSFTKKTVTNTENGDYKSSQGAGDRNDRSRVLAHLTRDVPRVAIYSSERSGGKGGSHGGPAVGGGAAVGAAANTSSQANNGSGHSISSTSTDNPNNHRDSQISSSPKCAPTSSTSSSSSSTFKVVVGSTNLQPFTSTPPSTSAHPHPSKSCSIPKTHGTTQSASISTTPYNPNLNGMNSVLHASLQKLEADSLPIVNSTLRRPSEPRKLLGTHLFNSALDAEKEKLLSSERISLVKNHGPFCEQETTKETPGTEAIARGNLSSDRFTWENSHIYSSVHENLLPLRKIKRVHQMRQRRRKPPPSFHANRIGQTDAALNMGIKLPEHNAIIHMPRVPYVNVNVSYKAPNFYKPKLKYMQTHTTLDRMQQVNAELEKLHQVRTAKIN